jgi:hypothetical protein
MPAPVVVRKDVGGFVNDYEAQTAIYRVTGREVRLHECRSACTLALGLPNVCVYPGSVLKFHQAYDPRNRQADEVVSQQLFNSYPVAVRARLGGLTRDYRVLRGSDLIALGIRNCSDTRTMVATAAVPRRAIASRLPRGEVKPSDQGSILDGLVQGVMAVFKQPVASTTTLATASTPVAPAKIAPADMVADEVPLPPKRPPEIGSRLDPSAPGQTIAVAGTATDHGAVDGGVPVPPHVPEPAELPHTLPVSRGAPEVISGAQAILPAQFAAHATDPRGPSTRP